MIYWHTKHCQRRRGADNLHETASQFRLKFEQNIL